MSDYSESKKTLDAIRRKYSSAGDLLLRTAFMQVVENGKDCLTDADCVADFRNQINERHDKMESENKIPFISRDFEMAILDCAVEIAAVDTMSLCMYLQREIWMYNNDISYPRAIELLQEVIEYISASTFGEPDEMEATLNELHCIGFDNDEIKELGFDYLLPPFDDDETEEDDE